MPRYLAVRVAVHHCKISNVPFLPFAIATIANHTTWTRYLRTTHRMAAESTLPPTLRQHGEAHRHLACILWCVVHVFNLELGDRRATHASAPLRSIRASSPTSRGPSVLVWVAVRAISAFVGEPPIAHSAVGNVSPGSVPPPTVD